MTYPVLYIMPQISLKVPDAKTVVAEYDFLKNIALLLQNQFLDKVRRGNLPLE